MSRLASYKPDRVFLGVILILALIGFFIFSSAALGQLSKDGADFMTVVSKQFLILLAGMVMLVVFTNISYLRYKKIAWFILLVAIALNLLLLIPGLAMEAGGAKRWLLLGPLTFQPADFLKLAGVIFMASWVSQYKDYWRDWVKGFLPFVFGLGLVGLLVTVLQRDIGTSLALFSGLMAIFVVSGGRWSQFGAVVLLGVVALGAIVTVRPYAMNRLITFLNPDHDKQGASWQLNQSLIAIGSGQMFGRGFGQSVQKFNYLPEPIGDSIFAVASEEFGFVGSTALVLLFVVLALWGLKIASATTDLFGRYLAAGLSTMITAQAFVNMGAMMGLIPLTGVPLVLISHGGTSLLFVLIEAGIILNISRHKKS